MCACTSGVSTEGGATPTRRLMGFNPPDDNTPTIPLINLPPGSFTPKPSARITFDIPATSSPSEQANAGAAAAATLPAKGGVAGAMLLNAKTQRPARCFAIMRRRDCVAGGLCNGMQVMCI
jgi:hypothetical protein